MSDHRARDLGIHIGTGVVGPLIEVPVMLFLVWSPMRLAPRWFGVKPGETISAPAPASAAAQVA